jgi:hypothetical protein
MSNIIPRHASHGTVSGVNVTGLFRYPNGTAYGELQDFLVQSSLGNGKYLKERVDQMAFQVLQSTHSQNKGNHIFFCGPDEMIVNDDVVQERRFYFPFG